VLLFFFRLSPIGIVVVLNGFLLGCQYGRVDCDFSGTCTEDDQCQCIFNCDGDGETVEDEQTGLTYANQCQLDRARCNSYYQQTSPERGMLARFFHERIAS
jgi:hypothetical protein